MARPGCQMAGCFPAGLQVTQDTSRGGWKPGPRFPGAGFAGACLRTRLTPPRWMRPKAASPHHPMLSSGLPGRDLAVAATAVWLTCRRPRTDEDYTPMTGISRDPRSGAAAGRGPAGDPRAAIWNLIRGPWRFAAVHALAELGCPGYLGAGPLPVPELAARCQADPALLERLLRCAASAGLLAEPSPGCYALTRAGRMLVPGVPGSMHAAVLAAGDEAAWQALTALAATAWTGKPAFTVQQGRGFDDYLAAHPARARIVGDVRASRSADIAGLIARLDFTGSTVIAEIGGGRGTILTAVLAAHRHLHGVLFDRPEVLGDARDYLAGAALTGRTELVAGDYLAGPVPPASTYLLASVLHDHDDGQARVILGNLRAAASTRPRLILADILLPDRPAPHIGCDLDVQMMALGTGRERTRAAYLALLGDAGFTATEVIGTPYGLSIIDARPAPEGTA